MELILKKSNEIDKGISKSMKIEKMSTEQGGNNYKKIEQLIFLLFCFIQTTKRTQFSREGHFSLLPHISTNLIKEHICHT